MKKFNTYKEFLNEGVGPLKHLTQEQVDWCNKHIEGKWSVNGKGEVTVSKNLSFKDRSFKDRSFERFPVQFAPVKGSFDCRDCPKLTSLEGAPTHVGGDFYCENCPKLASLEGAPEHVGGGFWCSHCPDLVSLEGAPAHVGGYFSCGNCPELPSSFVEIIRDYNDDEIAWKRAHKLINSKTYMGAKNIGLI